MTASKFCVERICRETTCAKALCALPLFSFESLASFMMILFAKHVFIEFNFLFPIRNKVFFVSVLAENVLLMSLECYQVWLHCRRVVCMLNSTG